jgi:hypothetical protein
MAPHLQGQCFYWGACRDAPPESDCIILAQQLSLLGADVSHDTCPLKYIAEYSARRHVMGCINFMISFIDPCL